MSENGESTGLARLTEGLGKVKSRSGPLPVERWLLIGGALMVALGIPLIVMAWYGAAHTPYVFEQIPYLISGGLLGVALAVVGGLFYFSYWLTRQVQETRKQGEESRAVLARLEVALLAVSNSAPAASNGSLVATRTGTMVHLPTCVVVANRTDLRTVKAGQAGFEPCKICEPFAVV